MAFVFLSSWSLSLAKFNYQECVSTQTDGNKRKIAEHFVDAGTIEAIAKWMKNEMKVEGVVCGVSHGTRRGLEQRIFRDLLPNSNVFGTEISDTATKFEHTIQWDYYLKKPEWEGHFDFIYSNTCCTGQDPPYDGTRCLTKILVKQTGNPSPTGRVRLRTWEGGGWEALGTPGEPDEAQAQFGATLGDSGRRGDRIPPNLLRSIEGWGSTLGIWVTCLPVVQPSDEGDRAT
eukprot:scaffold2657_cov368-Pavlova_lutheri.AAC.2